MNRSTLQRNVFECFEIADESIFNTWDRIDCNAVMETLIKTDPSYFTSNIVPQFRYTEASYENAKKTFNKLFNWYTSRYQITNDTTSEAYNPFQEKILDMCLNRQVPGVCDDSMTNLCNAYTRQEVLNNPTLTNFCGCYVAPDSNYKNYTYGTPNCLQGSDQCTMCLATDPNCVQMPSCDSLCNRASTIQKSYSPTGDLILCPRGVCVIDNVSINIQNSTVRGGVNFNTNCSGCQGGAGGCYCVIGSVDISTTMANIGVGTNFNQLCGEDSVCVILDEQGNQVSSQPCKDLDINPNNAQIFKERLSTSWTFIIFVVLFLILGIILLLIARYYNKK